ncbi:hypothetical protein F2P81_002433 [Scophthalmus maximus]|uniref:Uncharacterized protein n=1 Tax=Scophthalmus maximus TaxID=52904 RepID=A0A6A4TRP8_SCOMX|nr:hypothetical protein F2P81_002433 [Scophthalmus maximus]
MLREENEFWCPKKNSLTKLSVNLNSSQVQSPWPCRRATLHASVTLAWERSRLTSSPAMGDPRAFSDKRWGLGDLLLYSGHRDTDLFDYVDESSQPYGRHAILPSSDDATKHTDTRNLSHNWSTNMSSLKLFCLDARDCGFFANGNASENVVLLTLWQHDGRIEAFVVIFANLSQNQFREDTGQPEVILMLGSTRERPVKPGYAYIVTHSVPATAYMTMVSSSSSSLSLSPPLCLPQITMANCAQLVHKVTEPEGGLWRTRPTRPLTLAAAGEHPEEVDEFEHHFAGRSRGRRTLLSAAVGDDEGETQTHAHTAFGSGSSAVWGSAGDWSASAPSVPSFLCARSRSPLVHRASAALRRSFPPPPTTLEAVGGRQTRRNSMLNDFIWHFKNKYR